LRANGNNNARSPLPSGRLKARPSLLAYFARQSRRHRDSAQVGADVDSGQPHGGNGAKGQSGGRPDRDGRAAAPKAAATPACPDRYPSPAPPRLRQVAVPLARSRPDSLRSLRVTGPEPVALAGPRADGSFGALTRNGLIVAGAAPIGLF